MCRLKIRLNVKFTWLTNRVDTLSLLYSIESPAALSPHRALESIAARTESAGQTLVPSPILHDLQQISKAIKEAIADFGHDTDRNQVLGNTPRIVNRNLEMLRKPQVKDLQYDPAILERGLLKHMEWPEATTARALCK